MTGALGLLLLLSVPIVAWLIVHRRPAPKVRTEEKPSGPKHRWWQP
jgi:hypothetical protein